MKQSIVHIALVVQDYDEAIAFYTQKLNFEVIEFGENRKALKFGSQKINRFFQISVCRNERLFAIHHPGACFCP